MVIGKIWPAHLISLVLMCFFMAVVDIAFRKPTKSSSQQGSIGPSIAVSGDSFGVNSEDTCHTTKPEIAPWWSVNLLESYIIHSVRLVVGQSCCGKCMVRVLSRDSRLAHHSLGRFAIKWYPLPHLLCCDDAPKINCWPSARVCVSVLWRTDSLCVWYFAADGPVYIEVRVGNDRDISRNALCGRYNGILGE